MKVLIAVFAIATVLAMGAGLFTEEARWNRSLDKAPIQNFVVERQMGVDDITLVLAGWSKDNTIPRAFLRDRFEELNGGNRPLKPGETVKFPKYQ